MAPPAQETDWGQPGRSEVTPRRMVHGAASQVQPTESGAPARAGADHLGGVKLHAHGPAKAGAEYQPSGAIPSPRSTEASIVSPWRSGRNRPGRAGSCAFPVAPALGVPDHGFDLINLDPNSNIGVGCTNTNTPWIEYPQAGEASWWNTWAYDGQLDLERWKRIDYVGEAVSVDVAGKYYVEIALNWSTADYPPNLGSPPSPARTKRTLSVKSSLRTPWTSLEPARL